ncbi:tetratricopeptide repeat protein [Ruegeria sp. HKCCD7255]|uniref:tetratricopeptide repeat protein n=1 Tax=Ruegeria sp. HKCCD7255 TaxID=2683004 RepID=UPI001C2BCF57|nr:hypothetical protein [Ruegeria sp. HKCCD7255]
MTLELAKVKIHEPARGELLEGAPIFDDAFETWLHKERQSLSTKPLKTPATPTETLARIPQRKIVSITTEAPNEPMMEWFVQSVTDSVARLLNESFSVDVRTPGISDNSEAHWQVHIGTWAFEHSNVRLRLSLECPSTKTRIWANEAIIPVAGSPPTAHPHVQLVCNQLIEAVGDELLVRGDCVQSADRDCRLAIRSLFKMNENAAAEADKLFATAFATNPRGLYLAWRAQCLTITKAERYASDPKALEERADALCAQALELEPNNSMVLATVANTQGQLFRNHKNSFALAKRAVQLNPANPMAWWALSSASVYIGEIEASLKHAVRAGRLVTTLPNKFWWDNQLFGSALVAGKLKLALAFAEECHAQNPGFRPPLRYLVALYSNMERIGEVEKAVTLLKELEPDFSVHQLITDKSYPASLLHKAPGMDLDRLRAFI